MAKSRSKNIVIISSLSFYCITASIIIWLYQLEFSGDAAGRGLGAAFAIIYGFGAVSILALLNFFIYLIFRKDIKQRWLKGLVFFPALILGGLSLVYFTGGF